MPGLLQLSGSTSLQAPSLVDLNATHDAGSSFTDNITNINTPRFDIICASAPLAGDFIDIAKDGVLVNTVTLASNDIPGTTSGSLGQSALADGTYTFTARHRRTGYVGTYSSGIIVTIDTVAPTLSSPSGAQNGSTQSSADLSVTTNKGQGIIYWVVLADSEVAPSAGQILLGQDSTDTYVTAGMSGSISVSSTGAKTATATGIAATDDFIAYFIQTDTAGNVSSVSTSSSWTQTIVAFTANGVGGFDASSTYLSNASLSGLVDGKKGLLSTWIKVGGGGGTDRYVFGLASGATIKFWIRVSTSNVFAISARNAGGSDIMSLVSKSAGNPFTSTPTGWIHVAAWWDLASSVGDIYINGALFTNGSPTRTNDTIVYNRTKVDVGANPNGDGSKYNGSMSEFYLNIHDTLDLGVTANLQKFRDSGGNPVSLGANGSSPTGTQPEFYLGGTHDNTNWGSNLGTAGNLTVTGSLTSVGGPP